MVVTAVAGQGFAGAQLQPVLVAAADASAVLVHHADGERHVGGYLDLHRAVGLDWRITDDLAHLLLAADTESTAVKIQRIAIRDGHGLDEAQEARPALIGRDQGGIGQLPEAGDIGVAAAKPVKAAIEIVDAADMQQADVFISEILIQLEARDPVVEDGRSAARRGDHGLFDDPALFGQYHGQLSLSVEVIDVDAIDGEGLNGIGRDVVQARQNACFIVFGNHSATLAPAHQGTVGTVPQGIDTAKAAIGRDTTVGAHIEIHRRGLRGTAQNALLGPDGLGVVDIVGDIDECGCAAAPACRAFRGLEHGEDPAIFQLAWVEELHIVGTVVVCTVHHLQLGAVGANAV